MAVVACSVAAAILGRVPGARAGDLARPRPPVRLELAACLAGAHDAIERAVRVEVGDPPDPDDASAVAVAVECVADGLDAGVIVEVCPPGSPRRYRYALDWRTQPLDARPRLIGLAVAEAVDASRIELTAVPEPSPPPGPAIAAASRAAAAATGDWSIAMVGAWRAFSARNGVGLLGVGLVPARRLSARLRLSADLLAETATVITTSGAVAVLSVSSAPRIAVRLGDRLHGELGAFARFGIVRMHGEALPGSRLAGTSQVRLWLGPAVDLTVGLEVTPRVSLRAGVELGVVAIGATARDLGEPVAAIGGTWTSLAIGAVLEL